MGSLVCRPLHKRDLHLGETSRQRIVHSLNNAADMRLDKFPASLAKHDDSNLATGEILLVPKILISSHQNLEPCCLRFRKKLSILQLLPTTSASFSYAMSVDQVASESTRSTIVEKYEHLRLRSLICALGRKLKNRVHLLTGHTKLVHKFFYAHVLKILKDRGDRHTRSPKYPGPTALAWNALHR